MGIVCAVYARYEEWFVCINSKEIIMIGVNFGVNNILLQNLGACVDTIF